MFGKAADGTPLIGNIYSEDEIWSCTTCGACEEECPLLVEYIDKIVDLRRGMIDEGNVPQSLQKPLKALESRLDQCQRVQASLPGNNARQAEDRGNAVFRG